MKAIFERFKNGTKGAVKPLIAIFAAGVLLLVLAQAFRGREEPRIADVNPSYTARQPAETGERGLEERLAEILSLVEGAGRVNVLLHTSRGPQRVYALDETRDESETIEKDGEGGERSQRTSRTASSHVTLNRREGGQEPLILYENAPRIEGVIIVAEGGSDIFVRDALKRATSSLLGVAIHNVTVLPMAAK
jgi:stage III sporulation protein AG